VDGKGEGGTEVWLREGGGGHLVLAESSQCVPRRKVGHLEMGRRRGTGVSKVATGFRQNHQNGLVRASMQLSLC
jgi:hypothetical protein